MIGPGGNGARPARGPLSEETRAMMRTLVARYPEPRSALLPMLYLVQAEHGFISDEGVSEISAVLGLTKAEIAAVSTFYTMFKRDPMGRWLVSVCTQPQCAMAGSLDIVKRLEQELGVSSGGTTEDEAISIEEVECLCACDGAPVLQVNYTNYERLSVDEAVEMVLALRRDEVREPARGPKPLPRHGAHVQLSGVEAIREETP